MSVELNHTIVHSRDNRESAAFLAHILGLEVGAEWGPFVPVDTSNKVTLDFATVPAESIVMQHYAFLVSDEEFDAALDRIERAGITYFADPHGRQPGEINHHHGGRGLYFMDPSGHGMEIITAPYALPPSQPTQQTQQQ
ncbi:VOC family protein [Streptomyces rishiriensis]|uniref:VOC family protein n=1 Tax=Streptomyces rishiriensis TaxID=68264 RepID=UPI0037963511